MREREFALLPAFCLFVKISGARASVCVCVLAFVPSFVCLLSAVVFFFFLKNKGEVIDWACGGGEEEMRW